MLVSRLALAAGLCLVALSGPALAGGKQQCPPNATLVSLDSKTCPNGVVRQRACCRNPKGKVRCDSFPHCPSKSPSGGNGNARRRGA